ncbi:MAG: translocation/assembly module TamB domain-containing protein [Comamonadaceae bacterium]|nr:translocation/assembly module TamB domain-containing protein [Comamonadaceae bacterium]
MVQDKDEPVVELTGIEAGLHSDGQVHRIERLRFDSPAGTLNGHASVGAESPFALQAGVELAGVREGKDYRVQAAGQGNLSAFTLAIDAEGMNLKGAATIEAAPFAAVPFRRVKARVAEIDPGALSTGAPRAALTLEADLQPLLPQEAVIQLAPEQWILAGPIAVTNRTPGTFDRDLLPLRSLQAQARWEAARLTLSDIDLRLTEKGRASGGATWDNETLVASIDVGDLSLRELASTLKPTRLAGTLRLRAAQSEQRLEANLREPRFTARFDASHREGTLEVKTARIEAKGAGLDASGSFVLAGRQQFDLRGKLTRFDPSLFAAVPKALLNADVDARGSLQPEPVVAAKFALRDSRFDGKPLSGQGNVVLQGQRLEQSEVTLDLAGNRLAARGAFGRPGDRLQLSIDAPQLAALGHGLAGTLKGEAALSGTVNQPSLQFDAAARDLALQGQGSIARADAKGELREGLDGRFNARVELAGLRQPTAKAALVESAILEADGTRRDHVLRAQVRLGKERDVTLEAAGGLADAPAWSGMLRTFEVTGKPPLRLAAPVALELAPARVAIGPADLRRGDMRALLQETSWTPQAIVTRGEVSGLAIGVGFDAAQRPVVTGDGVTLGGEWDLRLADHVDGMARVFRQSGDLTLAGDAPVSLGLQTLELRLNADSDRLGWSLEAAGTRLGEISGAGTALAERAGSGWRLAPNAAGGGSGARRHALRRVARPLARPQPEARRRAAGGVRHHRQRRRAARPGHDPRREPRRCAGGSGHAPVGRHAAPGFRPGAGAPGVAEIRHRCPRRAARQAHRLPRALRQAGQPRSVRRFRARLRPRPTAGGRRPAQRGAARGPLADGFGRWPGRVRTDGHEPFRQGEGGRRLLGTDQGSGAQSVRRRGGEGPAAGGGAPPAARHGRGGGSRQQLLLQWPRPRQPARRPGAGTQRRPRAAARQRLDPHPRRHLRRLWPVPRDRARDRELPGPLDNPGLNVVALRKNLPVEAGVSVTGTVLNPVVKLVSEPNVPDPEKLSWIVLGRGQDQAGGGDSALLLSAAGAILGGQSGGMSRQLANSLGLDQIAVTSGELGAGSSRLPTSTVAGSQKSGADASLASQIVTVGKRLSAQTYLSFEQSLGGAESIVKITHYLTRRLVGDRPRRYRQWRGYLLHLLVRLSPGEAFP